MSTRLTENAKRVDAYKVDPADLVIVGLDTEATKADLDDPTYDRERVKLLDASDETMIALSENIARVGVIEPVIVRKDGDVLKVLVGRRRVFAARMANKRLAEAGQPTVMVPILARRGNEGDLYGVVISENELRVDDPPSVKASKVARYMNFLGGESAANLAAAATIFGVTTQTIRNYLSFSDLAAPVRALVDEGKLTATAAIQLAPLPKGEQAETAAEMVKEGKTTVENARTKRVRKTQGDDAATRPSLKVVRAVVRLATEQAGTHDLDSDAVRVLRWVLGELSTTSIKGLTELVNRAESGE
jgi:ParB family chromosome partitioning protein